MEAIEHAYHNYIQQSRRVPLSIRYPFLRPYVMRCREQLIQRQKQRCGRYATRQDDRQLPYCLARHQSVLRRRLGDSDPQLQENKIINLRVAAQSLDGLTIEPGASFSLSHVIGKPTRKRGYVDGMLLLKGQIYTGVGGGLCQLSNLLCWLMLHSDMTLVERYHHSRDVFPDSGRVVPFGSGATFVYQLRDVVFRNTTSHTIQLRIRLTDKHLKGELRSPVVRKYRYSIAEYDHRFVTDGVSRYRYNRIYRAKIIDGNKQDQEFLFENFAPVLYEVDEGSLREKGYEIYVIQQK